MSSPWFVKMMVRFTPRRLVIVFAAVSIFVCYFLLSGNGSVRLDETWSTAKLKKYSMNADDSVHSPLDGAAGSRAGKKLRVLVFASKRSGSSFFSELFNHNLDFVYYYEPLTYLTFESMRVQYRNDVFDRKAVEVIKCLFKWDFAPLAAIAKTKALGRICRHGREMLQTTFCRASPRRAPGPLITLADLKHSKAHIAIKTIRLYDLDVLRPIASDPDINLKVIHLVRDPRGIWNSRLNLNKTNYDFVRRRTNWDEVTDLCKNMLDNYKLALRAPQWLQGKYFLARYEDIALNPLAMATRVYQFLGIPLPDRVTEWVTAHTQESRFGRFGTTRNSSSVVAQWRHQLPIRTVYDIQNKCHAVMNELGYVKILKDSDLTNKTFNVIGEGSNILL
ncbi:carbohydrate sulfotransferase 1-like [Ptychodera flava]|uniref:carbohydrate sulfotransferase 1-like n=1 Tax=Ptychodera flava TaxID=63121 RepID=UPI003969F453